MRPTIRLGKVAGIPIGVHWSVFVIMVLLAQGLAMSVLPAGAGGHAVVFYWAVAVAVAAVFMASLLAHELAHALVARHYGVRVRRITLWLLGGVAELDGQASSPRGDLLIAGVGPAVSLLAGLVFGAAAFGAQALDADSLTVAALAWLAVINAVLAVFNLLPGVPLDGGRVLAAVLWWLRGDRAAAHRAACRAGVVLGWLLIAVGLAQVLATDLEGLWLGLLGWFLIGAATAENSETMLRSRLTGLRVGDVMTPSPACGYASQSVSNFISTVAWRRPYRTFPVLYLDGRLAGVISLAQLAKVPPANRDAVRLRDVITPRDQVLVLDPGSPLAEAAPTLSASRFRLAVVAVDDHVSGVLSVGDIARAVDLAALGAKPDHPGDVQVSTLDEQSRNTRP
jgi:Zn-dependent protease/predicted transcriptional regulator